MNKGYPKGVSMIWRLVSAMLVIGAIGASPARAHLESDSFLKIETTGDRAKLRWDLPLLNLEPRLKPDGKIDEAALRSFLANGVTFKNAGVVCTTEYGALRLDERSAGSYAVVEETLSCPHPLSQLQIDYRLFFQSDPEHKAFVNLENRGAIRTVTLSRTAATATLVLSRPERFSTFVTFVVEGIWHIWIGFDHILFLLTLLLPAALLRRDHHWVVPDNFRSVLREIIEVVTSFTVAHSLTLALASLQIVELPTRLVESAIALSVVLTALNNITPIIERGRWRLAFVFGLIHGFGFASVLSELGLPREHLVLALLGFNAGVEIGQLAIVAAVFPILYSLRRTVFYRRYFLLGGSGMTALVALLWFIERSIDLKFLPF